MEILRSFFILRGNIILTCRFFLVFRKTRFTQGDSVQFVINLSLKRKRTHSKRAAEDTLLYLKKKKKIELHNKRPIYVVHIVYFADVEIKYFLLKL